MDFYPRFSHPSQPPSPNFKDCSTKNGFRNKIPKGGPFRKFGHQNCEKNGDRPHPPPSTRHASGEKYLSQNKYEPFR